MDLMTAQARAVKVMVEHGLFEKGWTFSFDRATSRLGQTDFGKKRITISRYFTGAATEEEFEQTLIHELAHALLPPFAKHGELWKRTAKELGYTGKRLARNPYKEQQRNAKRPSFTPNPVSNVGGMGAAAANPSTPTKFANKGKFLINGVPTLEAGDMLRLPNGMQLKVETVNGSQTKATEVKSGAVWNLSTPDAHRFLVV